ncbi:MAG: HD-GYP domain-containing protein [Phycisphaerales bacterium]|nr:HD-GYP domain-containing protein [Phycisphaerae bacterium]NNF44969.1 HD-GYP domain-containing protein [Phycisphaerales bacterium]NNM25998.1 HD-GYP domain-containing protein [Phycisphaerales bacterium]
MSPDLVQAFVRSIELKDASTAAHTWRVVLYARALAERLGVPPDDLRRITYAAALHDIGKIDIPGEILRKPGALTDEEFEIVKTHTTLGHERLVRMGETDPILLELVRHHHERWDGLGYPDGLAGEAIPLGPRLFAVIDTFDALTSIRPYRQDVGPDAAERALVEIDASRETRYWPEAARLFRELYETGGVTWILHYFNDSVCDPIEAIDRIERIEQAETRRCRR